MHAWGNVIAGAVSLLTLVGAAQLQPAAPQAPTEGSGESAVAQRVVYGPERVFIIPAGTTDRQLRGDRPRLLPEVVRLRVGETLIIENQDDGFHSFGWFLVAPGQRYEQVFDKPGSLMLFDWGCSGGSGYAYNIVVEMDEELGVGQRLR